MLVPVSVLSANSLQQFFCLLQLYQTWNIPEYFLHFYHFQKLLLYIMCYDSLYRSQLSQWKKYGPFHSGFHRRKVHPLLCSCLQIYQFPPETGMASDLQHNPAYLLHRQCLHKRRKCLEAHLLRLYDLRYRVHSAPDHRLWLSTRIPFSFPTVSLNSLTSLSKALSCWPL